MSKAKMCTKLDEVTEMDLYKTRKLMMAIGTSPEKSQSNKRTVIDPRLTIA